MTVLETRVFKEVIKLKAKQSDKVKPRSDRTGVLKRRQRDTKALSPIWVHGEKAAVWKYRFHQNQTILAPKFETYSIQNYKKTNLHSLTQPAYMAFFFNQLWVVKNLTAKAGDIRDTGLISGWGRSPGGRHGNPLHYPCLENPMDRGISWATVHEVAKSRTRLSDLALCRWTSRALC